ncbi:MAG TPA: hypothetical protein VFW34_10030 [Candidatus Rubrimentiphilum sp.]|nr:hypothetical protein [Candidatus Rubrimentiphilum sp.]
MKGEAFSYLSVLVSIVLGLGIAHLLGSVIRLIVHRGRIGSYWPSVIWVINLLLIMLLVWWTDFSLTSHTGWTFAIFVFTIAVPALLYVISGLILPPGVEDMQRAYQENRQWFFALLVIGILATFGQSYLLDGHLTLNADFGLKLLMAAITAVPIFLPQDTVQKTVAVASLAWTVSYIVLLFNTLPHT